jgi:hypothetical protein
MKKLPLYIASAIVVEFAVIALATILGLNGITLYVTIGLLPVALIAASIYFFIRPGPEEPPGEGDEADKEPH